MIRNIHIFVIKFVIKNTSVILYDTLKEFKYPVNFKIVKNYLLQKFISKQNRFGKKVKLVEFFITNHSGSFGSLVHDQRRDSTVSV